MIIATSPAFRIGSPAIFVVVLFSLFLGGCLRRTVVKDLSKDEARKVAVALDKGGVRSIPVEQTRLRGQDQDKWQVDIHGGDRTLAEALRLLQENDLPPHDEAGIEVYPKEGNLIPTASEERIRFLYAVSGELSRTLKSYPCVNDARVHVMSPDASMLRDSTEKPHATASVLLIYAANCPHEPPKDQLATLVAGGVEGLDEKNVYVVSVQSPPPRRDQLDDLKISVTPSPGLVLDYAYWCGGILLTLFALGAAIRFAPGTIRWVRTQTELLRESVTD